MIDSINSIAIVTSRVALLEIEFKKMAGALERLSNQIATGSPNISKTKFKTLEEMAHDLIKAQLTKDQHDKVLSTKRDEATSRLRGEVICELYKRGVSGTTISRILKKDHNTIYYHLALAGLVRSKDNKRFSTRRQSRLNRMRRRISLQLDNF